MILDEPRIEPGALARRTGWDAKPEGLCKADTCVPLPAQASGADGLLDARVVAERLGAPLLHDEASGLWCLGPEGGGRLLASAALPEITLPDLDGRLFSFSSLRGRKVVLVAWASW